jgi:hypothetical protein
MTSRPDLESIEHALFSAARVEVPSPASRERAAALLRRALREERHADDGEPEQLGPQRGAVRWPPNLVRIAGLRWVWAGAALTVAAAVIVLLATPGRVKAPGMAPDLARVDVRITERRPPEAPLPVGSVGQHANQRQPSAREDSAPDGPRGAPKRPPSLGAEVELLERARAALANNDPRRALRELDAYAKTLRGTRLRDEATLLRIDALARSGQHDAAQALARRFVDQHPDSPLADRARMLTRLGDGSKGSGTGGEP